MLCVTRCGRHRYFLVAHDSVDCRTFTNIWVAHLQETQKLLNSQTIHLSKTQRYYINSGNTSNKHLVAAEDVK